MNILLIQLPHAEREVMFLPLGMAYVAGALLENAVKSALDAGLFVVAQMIFGYPGEDDDSIRETAEFYKRVNYYPPYPGSPSNVSLLTPLPGSSLYNQCVKDGRIADEVEWLKKIERGYYPRAPLLMNFTGWDDKTLIDKKLYLVRTLYRNYKSYMRSHPLSYAAAVRKEALRLMKKSVIFYQNYGAEKTIKRIRGHFPSRLNFKRNYGKLQHSIAKNTK